MSDGIFSSFRVSAMGLRAQRIRLDVAAENLANVETTRTAEGGPYRAKQVTFKATAGVPAHSGVVKPAPVSFSEILAHHERHLSGGPESLSPPPVPAGPTLTAQVREIEEAFISEYDPQHPDADESGVVLKPNVDPINEMMTLIKATRAYEANATALDAAKEMLNRALEI
jgi:flagellar basal-body rod protein FlgC